MFPSFTSLSQRERKRQELLRQAEKELAIERQLNQRYAETMWAADNESGLVSLTPSTVSTSVQTTAAPATATSATTPATATPGVFSIPSGLTNDISVQPTISSSAASDMVNLDTDHIMYRPDQTMDEVVSKREDRQSKTYQAVVELFKLEPDVASWDLHPMFDPMLVSDAKAKRDMFFLGPGAKLYHKGSRRAVHSDKQDDLIEVIDWEATLEYILDRIRLVDGFTRARQAREKLTSQRIAFNGLKANADSTRLRASQSAIDSIINRVEQDDLEERERDGESRYALNSIVNQIINQTLSKDSRTDDINRDAKTAFIDIVRLNRSVVNDKILHTFNGKPGLYAIGRSDDLQELPRPLPKHYIDPISFKLKQISNHRQSNTKEKDLLSWPNTLQYLFHTAANLGIELNTTGTKILAAKRPLADSAVSVIELEEKRPNLNALSRSVGTNADMVEAAGDYKRLVYNLYTENPWLLREYLPPAVSKINNQYHPSKYYIDLNGGVRRIKGESPDPGVDQLASAEALTRMNVSWPLTFQGVLDYLIQAVQFYNENPDLVREHNFEAKLQQVRDSLRNFNIVIPRDAPGLSMDDLEMKPAVIGRGLSGAGYINKELKDKEGNPIKYHSHRGYNLAQLEGTGTFSSMAYKRVGTKFVHLPKLNENLLKVVYPNRSTVGAQRKISTDLSQLIKTLVFDGTIDQQLYDSLPMDDKRVFHELLRITHTQHAMRDPVKDPRDVLKQEYIKLKGELMLGNDNPAMIRELKQVLVDMYSAKLISDDEFKQVLLALV